MKQIDNITVQVGSGLREVTWAKLHAGIFVPTVDGKKGGNYKDTMSAEITGPDRDMKMYLESNHIVMYTRGLKVGIPLTNVINFILK